MTEEVVKPIEEATKEQPEEQTEVSKPDDTVSEVKEESNIPVKETEKEPESKTARLTEKKITCPKCSKTMNLRSYRYKHEKNCQGNLEERPIKKQLNPKTKVKAVPIQQIQQQNEVIQEPSTTFKEVKPRIIQEPQQPIIIRTPQQQIMDNYNLMHQEYLNKKKEKVNNLCSNMFSGNLRTKKR